MKKRQKKTNKSHIIEKRIKKIKYKNKQVQKYLADNLLRVNSEF